MNFQVVKYTQVSNCQRTDKLPDLALILHWSTVSIVSDQVLKNIKRQETNLIYVNDLFGWEEERKKER